MRTLSMSLALMITAVSCLAQQAGRPSVADLGWLAGCWEQERSSPENLLVTEQWTKPAGMMFGLGRTFRDGRVTEFENLRIEEKDGTVYYVARPSTAKDEVPFALKSLTAKTAIFENPNHDFPKKIMYTRRSKDRLEAQVEGSGDGFGFKFRRVRCE